MSRLEIQLPESVLNEARKLAEQDQIPLEFFVALAVTERVASLRGVAYLRARAERGRNVDIDALLAKVPDVPPIAGDETP